MQADVPSDGKGLSWCLFQSILRATSRRGSGSKERWRHGKWRGCRMRWVGCWRRRLGCGARFELARLVYSLAHSPAVMIAFELHCVLVNECRVSVIIVEHP
mmetsp:Transcript_12072/g.41978  ORF Transcript_12072/g.41978 Transcript_12072/m.41978 type:complete len:101 (-) Transcript_12072:192-494(-)